MCRRAIATNGAGCHRRLALRARRRWRGRCAPGRLRQPGRRLALALGADAGRRGRCAPGRLRCASSRGLRTLPDGGGDVEDVVRCVLLETLGARRASSSTAEGEGGEGWYRHHDARACGGTLCAVGACQPIVQVARRSVCTICCTVPSDSSAWPAHEHSRGALQPCSHVVLLSLLAIGVTQ